MPSPQNTDGPAPWDAKRNPAENHLIRRSLPWLGVVALLALITWGLWPKPILVETGTASRGPLTVRVSEEGKTRVRNRYVVAAPVPGLMRRLPFKPGDEVIAGKTVITVIEPVAAPLLDSRTRAQAEAAIAMRVAAQKQAAESLDAARATAKLATSNLDRVRSVTRSGSLSQSDRDRAEMDATVKTAEVRAAEFAQQVANYELVQARASIERPVSDPAEYPIEVKSPVSGRVLKVMQESEMVVNAGTPIAEIGDPTDLEIETEILSRDAVTIHPGDAVEIDQWGGDAPLKARVRRVEPAAFTKISALGVEEQRVIVLSDLTQAPEAAKALGDRYRVEVSVATWHVNDALIVPAGALFREGNAWKSYLFHNGTAKLTTVDAQHSDGRFTEIVSGLKVGDEVLLHPPDTVKDGSKITQRKD
jgi:HlyD family secretion protein